MLAVLLQQFSKFLPIISRFFGNRDGGSKTAISYKKGNEPAIDKLAEFCNSRSLLKIDDRLNICFLFNDQADIGAVFQRQIPANLGSITEVLPTLFELYTQLVVVAIDSDTDQAAQTDSSNRLYASLKRHPE